MIRLLTIIILTVFVTSCRQSDELKISDYVDHWEIKRTFKTYNNSTLDIDTIENEYQIVNGHNQVLIVTTENNPVFKEGKELSDLYSIESLLIELDTADNTVTAEIPYNSRLFRKLIAFSPDHGINPLDKDEKIKLIRNDKTVWTIEAETYDFDFSGQLDFQTNQTLTSTLYEY